MSDYEDGYEVGRNAPNIRQSYQNGKAIGNGLAVVLGLGFRLVVETLVLAPFLVLGLVLTTNLDFLGPGFGYARLLSIGALAYGFYALLYLLKGVAIGLRLRGTRHWLLPFTLCLLVACFIPSLLLHLFIVHTVKAAHPVLVWVVPGLFALYTYSRYRFTEDIAPNLVLWAYRRGYHWTVK
ncbi:hypothetical protein LRS06_23680 [Hymenobacter sp. J193]|uniref:hypothetical protein n=1 Tax=Hymenobacter sp. J193 TaxID=2898429 RepID=UPI002151BCCC|nr:hypothetical protein [Hymenobacter sp. J193]MCR5890731.1 hypothetical protein [Hymenobacter sp. J193]